jgi:hypothetical protein
MTRMGPQCGPIGRLKLPLVNLIVLPEREPKRYIAEPAGWGGANRQMQGPAAAPQLAVTRSRGFVDTIVALFSVLFATTISIVPLLITAIEKWDEAVAIIVPPVGQYQVRDGSNRLR